MPDSLDYREHIKEEFKHISASLEKISSSIDAIRESNIEIKIQTTLTNSRVTHLEHERDKYLATRVSQEKVGDIEKMIDTVNTKVEKIDKDLLEIWFFKKYPKVFIGILTAAVLATLGISYFNKRDMKEIRTKVNYIEAYEKIPFSPTRGAIKAFSDTSNSTTIKKID